MTTKIRFIIISALLLLFAIPSWAQLKEVRGVQTRTVPQTVVKGDGKIETRAYEFTNENSYPVWVEAELCTHGFALSYDSEVVAGTRDTKSFTLDAGESYVWKCGDRMVFRAYSWGDYSEKFYVKYKAYKAE
mgnify:CR=1 FL=1